MKTSSFVVRSLFAVGLFVGASVSAQADMSSGTYSLVRGPSKTVRYGDLDLSKRAGAETLYDRIKSAARSVCSGEMPAYFADCRAKAVEEAVAGVGNTLLAAVHRAATEGGGEVANRRQ